MQTTELNSYPAAKATDEVWWEGFYQSHRGIEMVKSPEGHSTVEARIAASMRINLAKILAVTRNNLRTSH